MFNLYDFDKTIYNGDSSVDFYLFCLKKDIKLIKFLPRQIKAIFLYKIRKISKEEMKENFFSYLTAIENVDILIEKFWTKKLKKIKEWYMKKRHENDIIISASPEFLLIPLIDILAVKSIIGSKVDKKTGKFLSKNCYGIEKVKRLFKKYPNIKIKEAYSDSQSDFEMLKLALEKYQVKGNKIIKLEI